MTDLTFGPSDLGAYNYPYQYPGYPEGYNPNVASAVPTTATTSVAPDNSSKKLSYIIIVITIVLAIIILAVLIYLAATKKSIFGPYVPPSSSTFIYPSGEIKALSAEQIAARKAVLTPGATGVTGVV
jgi:hypothetical protein